MRGMNVDFNRYIIIEITDSGACLAKGRDWLGFTYDWQEPVRVDAEHGRMVRFDDVSGQFRYLHRPITEVIDRHLQVGDILLGHKCLDAEGREYLTLWTRLEHYKEVDAAQPRCRHTQCDTKLLESDDDGFCRYHDPYREDGTCNGCGEVDVLCVCAELESLRRHNANPATRGSWWVA